jgi:hypothetical protein
MFKDKIILFLIIILIGVSFFVFALPRHEAETHKNFSSGIITPKEPVYSKGLYVTFRTAGNSRMDGIIDLIKRTELNTAVIDVKDFTGRIPFDTGSDLINGFGSEKIFIKDIKALINKLHQEGIYVIARIACFEDNYLPEQMPEMALKRINGSLWTNNNGLTWLDPTLQENWDYIVEIAREAVKNGFDEINLDYIRFPSDGDISSVKYARWDGTIPKTEIIRQFFEYVSQRIKPMGVFLSADLFGLTLTSTNDLNIGQWLEYAVPYFDYICPMVYPSHYPPGFLGFENPAEHPYEVIYNGLTTGGERIASLSTENPDLKLAKLRPWLQDFDMGANYDAEMIKLQKKAAYDADAFGWLLWNPKNVYTEEGLAP